MGARAPRAPHRALLTIVHYFWNNVAKFATFVHKIGNNDAKIPRWWCDFRAIVARFMHQDFRPRLSEDRDFLTIVLCISAWLCVALSGALGICCKLPHAAPCTMYSDLQCFATRFLPELCYFHDVW